MTIITYRIMQLPYSNNNLFMPYRICKDKISLDDYCCVWTGTMITTASSYNKVCEDLYLEFNFNHPKGFGGHSMSTSDIIMIQQDGFINYYFCDSFGFVKLEF